MEKIASPLFGGKSLEEWDRDWEPVPDGLKRRQSHLRGAVGLYRYMLGGRVGALGTGIDRKDGIAKRLHDFIRRSASGRDHHAGRMIHQYREQLVVEVLITGSGAEARRLASLLKEPMLERHRPLWSARDQTWSRGRRTKTKPTSTVIGAPASPVVRARPGLGNSLPAL